MTKFVGILYKLRKKLPRSVLKSLYYATTHSNILYGIEVYANVSRSALHDLIVLNNKLLRIIQFENMTAKIQLLYICIF